jgi:hypothetical protein
MLASQELEQRNMPGDIEHVEVVGEEPEPERVGAHRREQHEPRPDRDAPAERRSRADSGRRSAGRGPKRCARGRVLAAWGSHRGILGNRRVFSYEPGRPDVRAASEPPGHVSMEVGR